MKSVSGQHCHTGVVNVVWTCHGIHAGGEVEWLRCTTLQELLQAKTRLPGARLVAGNTEVGIEMHIKGARPSALLDPTAVPELQELREDDLGLLVSLWFRPEN